ncbi:MAG TPA: hypothetical protein VKD67_05130, partial [Acidimicrobiales bacterium]|nr:hypothetical protein [Acidimicrobiales bacterium]
MPSAGVPSAGACGVGADLGEIRSAGEVRSGEVRRRGAVRRGGEVRGTGTVRSTSESSRTGKVSSICELRPAGELAGTARHSRARARVRVLTLPSTPHYTLWKRFHGCASTVLSLRLVSIQCQQDPFAGPQRQPAHLDDATTIH